MATNELDLANRKYNTMCDTHKRRQDKLDNLLKVHDRVEAKYKEMKDAGEEVPKEFIEKRKAHKRKCTVARVAVKKITDEIEVHFEENPELAARYRPTEKDDTPAISNDYVPEHMNPAAAAEAEIAAQKELAEASKPLTPEKLGTLEERASAFSLPAGLTETTPEPEQEIDPSLTIIEDDGEDDEDEDRRIAMQNAAIDAANGIESVVVDEAKHVKVPVAKRKVPECDLTPEKSPIDVLDGIKPVNVGTIGIVEPITPDAAFVDWLSMEGYDLMAKGFSQHSMVYRMGAHFGVDVSRAQISEILTDVKGIPSMVEVMHTAYQVLTK